MGRNLKWALSLFVFMLGFEVDSQTSDYLSYQAILRGSNGNIQANAMVSVRVSILEGGSAGDALYTETHEVITNENGLFSLAIGGGITAGNYASIDWSTGQKFLKVEVDSGTGYVLLGVQGMQSVPYSLSAKSTSLRVSTAGDSLFIGGSYTIVPGISAANLPADVVLDVDGNIYNKVTIGSQVWLAENLKSTHFCNGDAISLVTTSAWSTTTTSAYCTYSDDPTMANTYGHLYNWFAASDTRNVCPCGWHVPSDAEWTTLAQAVDPATSTTCGPCNQSTLAGGVLKSTQFWTSPNTGGTDAVGFGALPGGDAISTGGYLNIGNQGYYWSKTSFSSSNAWYRRMSYTSANFSKLNDSKQDGFSIRCLQD